MKLRELNKQLIMKQEYTGFDERLREDDICPRCLNGAPMKSREICDSCEKALTLWTRFYKATEAYKNKYGDN